VACSGNLLTCIFADQVQSNHALRTAPSTTRKAKWRPTYSDFEAPRASPKRFLAWRSAKAMKAC
jgi:hypothetical protein